jgi:hypothetical protein
LPWRKNKYIWISHKYFLFLQESRYFISGIKGLGGVYSV